MQSHRGTIFVAVLSLILGACSGPIVSEYGNVKDLAGTPSAEGWTPIGSYCLPKTLLSVLVQPHEDASQSQKSDKPASSSSNSHQQTQTENQGSPQAGNPAQANPGQVKPAPSVGNVMNASDIDIILTPVPVSDPDATFNLYFEESAFSDDDVRLEYSKNSSAGCVLQKISSVSQDQTGAVIETVASTVLRAMSGVPSAGGVGIKALTRTPAVQKLPTIQLLLDGGADEFAKATQRLNSSLQNANYNIAIQIEPVAPSSAQEITTPKAGATFGGILYRAPRAFYFRVIQNQTLVAETVFYSESGAPLQFLPINRSAFVKRETSIEFDHGIPVAVENKKPSEALAAARIPLDLVTAIVSLPSQLLTLHVTGSANTQTSSSK